MAADLHYADNDFKVFPSNLSAASVQGSLIWNVVTQCHGARLATVHVPIENIEIGFNHDCEVAEYSLDVVDARSNDELNANLILVIKCDDCDTIATEHLGPRETEVYRRAAMQEVLGNADPVSQLRQ